MGGGDLNLKKSWHPLLIKNQEAVWKEEKKALEERKRTQQLLKEQAEERQIQELQRMGGKLENRVEWLYNAPAAGGGQNTEELEAYLLGKKSVEQLFNEQDRKRMAELQQASNSAIGTGANAAATPATFQALGASANNTRDLAAKVKLDPLLAIKLQEQRAYEELLKDPKRLQALKDARSAAKGDKKEKRREEKREKREKKHKHRSRYSDDEEQDSHSKRPRSRSPDRVERQRSRSPPRRRERSPSPYSRRQNQSHNDHRSSRDHRHEQRPPRPMISTSATIPNAEARLAAMQASAKTLTSARDKRLAEQAIIDRAAEERETAERERKMVKGGGNLEPQFLKAQQQEMLDRKLEGSGNVRYGQRAENGQD